MSISKENVVSFSRKQMETIAENHNQAKGRVLELRPNGYKAVSVSQAQGAQQKSCQKDCKRESIREFVVRFYRLVISEATPLMSLQHGRLSMRRQRAIIDLTEGAGKAPEARAFLKELEAIKKY